MKLICIRFSKNIRFNFLLVFLFSLLVFQLKAQDNIALQPFTSIDVFGRVEVKINYGEEESIRFKGDTTHFKSVKFEVKEGRLNIGLLSEFPPEIQIVLEVSCKKLDRVTIGGGCKIYNRGAIDSKNLELKVGGGSDLDFLVKTDSINIKVSKGGFARLTGECRSINLKTTTGGTFRATDIKNEILIADMLGGVAAVYANELVNAKVRYNAILKYKGQPKSMKKDEKLGGSIMPLEEDDTDE